jgi:endonuclease/exonuclease/phosphatase family protein
MRATWSLVVLIPLSIGIVAPDASARSDDGKKVTFMTQNLYLGADLAPAVGAIISGDVDAILTEVGGVWANVQATDFPTRAIAIADEVKAKKPDFLALQEAALWSVGAPLDPADADTVVYDFVQILLDALAARGMRYDVVAIADEFEAEATGYVPDSLYGVLDIRIKLRDALLVKHGGDMKITNASGHPFETNLVFDTPFGPISSTYGWVQADVQMGRREFRVIGTHFDADVPPIREIQAGEILAGPCDTDLPLVVMGDFNSDGNGGPTSAAYDLFHDAGFGDAWVDEHPDELGLTYGQEPTLTDADWPSTTTEPIERVDFVLYLGEFTSTYADRVGEETGDRIDGLWPSDHAGLAATLRVR